jgi:hypothetical protein
LSTGFDFSYLKNAEPSARSRGIGWTTGGKDESEPGRTTQAEAERRLREYIGGGGPVSSKGKLSIDTWVPFPYPLIRNKKAFPEINFREGSFGKHIAERRNGGYLRPGAPDYR